MQFISNYIRQLKKNKKLSYAYFDKDDIFSDKTPQLKAYRLLSRSRGDPFNFNPNEQSVYSLINEILIEVFDKKKQEEFENKQRDIDSLLKKRAEVTDKEEKSQLERKINDLRNKLTEAKQIKEKLKFTFKGFDVSTLPIPHELLHSSQDVSENDCLALLRLGYLNTQVHALFNMTHEQFDKLSIMGVKNRNRVEEAKYTKILNFLDTVCKFIDSIRANPSSINNKKLKNVKKMGKEGKKMYALLVQLLDDVSPRV